MKVGKFERYHVHPFQNKNKTKHENRNYPMAPLMALIPDYGSIFKIHQSESKKSKTYLTKPQPICRKHEAFEKHNEGFLDFYGSAVPSRLLVNSRIH